MSADVVAELAKVENIRGIKEASGDINRIHLIAREFPQIQLSCGADDQALEFFVWGASSWVTAIGNFFAKEVVAFYDICVHQKDFDKARAMMSALLPLTTLLERGGKFVQCTKYGSEYYGLPAGPVRNPLKPMKKELRRQMREVLDTAKATLHNILSNSEQKNEEEVRHVRIVN